MRAKHFMFLILASSLVAPTLLWSQPGPGGGGMKGKGNFNIDPDQIFSMMSGGADSMKISSVTDPRRAMGLKKIAEAAGVSGDVITREQYKTGFQNGMAGLAAAGKKGGDPQKGGGPPGGGGMQFGRGQGNPQNNEARLEGEARLFFSQMDQDQDGFISHDEAQNSQKLRDPATFEGFDIDHDEKLSFEEYKAFYFASKGNAAHDPSKQEIDEDARPTIFRVGKLPKELPGWFPEIDKKGDNDGQIGMDEWVKYSKKSIDEFLAMDLNSDGVLTAEEYLKFHKHQEELAKTNPLGTLAAAGDAAALGINPGGGGGRPGGGGGGGMMRPGGGGGGGMMRPGGGGGGGGMRPGGGGGGWGKGGDAKGDPAENPRPNGKGNRGNKGQ